MSRGLNKAQLIGNLTKDPELRYTPQGTAVCTFSIATNRSWTDSSGQKKDEATFHRAVAWSKLAEICGQYLKKGRRVFIEGRISNRQWEDKQGQTRHMTEVVVSDMLMLDGRKDEVATDSRPAEPAPPEPEPTQKESKTPDAKDSQEEIDIEDIPDDLGENKKSKSKKNEKVAKKRD